MHDPDRKDVSCHAIESAIEAIKRSLRTNGIDESGIQEGEEAGFEWRALFEWAKDCGIAVGPEVEPEMQGGREHDVTHRQDLKRWFKFTKPDSAGFSVELVDGEPIFLPATPSKYFRRLSLQNEVWGDDVRLEGIQCKNPGGRIITSQPDLPGTAVSYDDIHEFLTRDHSFCLLDIPPMGFYKSLSYLRGALGLFDVHPANFVRLQSNNQILPIDVIMVEFSSAEASTLAGRMI